MPSHIPQYGNLFEFEEEDVFRNTIKAHPRVSFYVHNNKTYYNDENQDATNFHTPNGHINLHELNVNRNLVSSSTDDQLIYPFVSKQGSFTSFSTVAASEFNLDYAYGDVVQGTYPLTASIAVDRYGTSFSGAKKTVLYALKNALDFYTPLSPHYAYSSSFGDKTEQKLNIISVPSIFYGSNIEKGSVRLRFYVTGTLIGEASDTKKNGVLFQTTGSTTGNSVGVVLYNEGFIVLTASGPIRDDHSEAYDTTSTTYNPSWHYFATSNSDAGAISSSFSIEFNGTTNIQTVTMFAHAKENQLNFSNNPTFLSESATAYMASRIYHQDSERRIKNIVSSSYANHSASYKPVTYISKVGIYDENKNLIAVASLANPVRKLEDRNYTFKLKLDI